MRSVMVHQFSQVPKADIPRSSFDRSHGHKSTFDFGQLVPIYLDEALPGDTFALNASMFARLATPLHPVMDNMFVDAFFFCVPLRLLQTNFVKMFGEQDNPDDSTSYTTPKMTAPTGGYQPETLHDYFGLPTLVAGIRHHTYYHRAYNKIWNEWFRDQNLQDRRPQHTGDSDDPPADYIVMRRGKRHDYFTSALPWPQKGPSVQLPLGAEAPVRTKATETISGANPDLKWRFAGGAAVTTNKLTGINATGSAATSAAAFTPDGSTLYPSNLYADLSAATAATINQIRQAFQIQRLYERDARGGTRYTELIQSHFGVTSPDARLQRSEYLGGGSAPINITPIPQTSSTSGQPTPPGSLSGFGTVTMGGIGFTKSFTEHSVIIGLVSARADLNYQQGLNRMFSRSTRFDFYWPVLSHLGEQAVLNKEIYAQGTSVDDEVFGYQERYAEYRYKPSIVTGQFRSNFPTSLDTWHLAQDFSTLPALNETFIEDRAPIERIIAVTDAPHLIFDSYFRLRCARPMPVYGVPGMMDHF